MRDKGGDKMKALPLIGLTLLLCSLSHAQPGWERTYGGTGDDEGQSVQQTFDGGYIIAGFSNSFGHGYDVYLIKTDPTGDTLWTRTYDADGAEYGYSVQQTSDSGYIIVGYAGQSTGVWLLKTDASGDTLCDLPPKYVPPSVLLFSCCFGYLGDLPPFFVPPGMLQKLW
jgi:hypothetical protein